MWRRVCVLGRDRPNDVLIYGDSVAGMLAAAVCANHFDSVLIIEAEAWANQHGDELPKERQYSIDKEGYRKVKSLRPGVMQYFAPNCKPDQC